MVPSSGETQQVTELQTTAKDVMRTSIVTLSPGQTLEQAMDTLLRNQVSCVAVTDLDGRVEGIISEFDLLDLLFDPSLREKQVCEFMTRDVHTVDETEPAQTLAHIFALYRIRRLPVVRNGMLVGMVSRRDLLRRFSDTENILGSPFSESLLVDLEDSELERRSLSSHVAN
ncbi:MAG: CBS domain-containing protein [Pirellulales bacterium]